MYFWTESFDTYIGSILNYGCEVWGFNKSFSHEIIHNYIQFCKRILGVKRSTTNMMKITFVHN